MPIKNAIAKLWNITPSSDGKRWSAYPAGDKPSGGSAPTWNDLSAIGPGWVYQSSYTVGTVLTADVGAAANSPNPNGYSYQVLRDGDPTGMPSGSGVSGFTYTVVSGDQFHEISFTLTASNGAGSDTTTAASVTIS